MRKIIVALLALCLVQPAFAVRITAQLEDAYELDLADVTLPVTATGVLGLAACVPCRDAALQLVAATEYYIDGRMVAYDELLEAVQRLRIRGGPSEQVGIYIFFDVATKQVNRLKLRASTVN